MKQKFLLLVVLLTGLSAVTKAQNNVGVNTTTPDPSAALDVQSTSQGMLIPRMTASQRGLIAAPATGLLVYQSDAPAGFYFYDGTVWSMLGATGQQGIQGIQGIQGVKGDTGVAGPGIPIGGTAGQILAKIDNTNFNTQWITSPTGDSSQLQKVTEPSIITLSGLATGWRILGRDTANYGNIGIDAIDLSFSNTPSTTLGATGSGSIAMGDKTTALAAYSTAIGKSTIASGSSSTAMGDGTTASGTNSTAMGNGTTSSGGNSTATGLSTTASGNASTSMGSLTTASGNSSTAMGSSTIASGIRSTAMGHGTTASGTSSTSMGIGTKAKSGAELTIGMFNDTITTPNNGFVNDSNRLFTVGNGSSLNNRKTAFVIQQDGNIGINQKHPTEKLDINGSIKIVDGTQGAGKVLVSDSNGKASWQTAALSDSSQLQKITENGYTGWRILGRDSANYGDIGIGAIDLSNSSNNSTTYGATGNNAFATGNSTTASGTTSTALGTSTTASGFSSTAMGNSTTASAIFSTAMGESTKATKSAATAMGYYTEANGEKSVAMGNQSEANGDIAVAIGSHSQANGEQSLATGIGTKANGTSSSAFGDASIASGNQSVAMGTTYANSANETTIGAYNDTLAVSDDFTFMGDSNRIFTVGNGNVLAAHTAFVIQQDGNIGINQRRPSEKLDINGSIKIADGTQGAGKVLTSDANGKASWQTVAAGGDSSQLQKITENGNTGWRILGADTANYGDIGDNAIDLSTSFGLTDTQGATGQFSTAFGLQTTASGFASTALGFLTIASANTSTTMGFFTKASGAYATAMGKNSTASGYASAAMGQNTTASGYQTTAIGDGTIASADNATAMGSGTKATAFNATAMGNSTTANAYNTLAVGYNTQANSFGETTIGYNNDTIASTNKTGAAGDSNRIFTVGNGTNTTPKTAFVIQQNGNIGVGDRKPTSTLDVNGSLSLPIDYFTNSVTLNGSHYTVFMNGSGKTITLPAAATCKGRIYKIINITTGFGAVASNISPSYAPISGPGSAILPLGTGIILQSDGSDWRQIP
jgi:hypothetical protein